MSSSRPLPPGWEMKTDARTGRSYFLNHTTKKTTWKDPRESTPVRVQEEKKEETQTDNDFNNFAQSRSILQDVSKVVAPMPPGWEAKKDARNGKTYYVNHLTKKTTWEDPRKAYYESQAADSSPLRPRRIPIQSKERSPSPQIQEQVAEESQYIRNFEADEVAEAARKIEEESLSSQRTARNRPERQLVQRTVRSEVRADARNEDRGSLAKGPNPDLRKGPNDDLLLTKYVEWHGPNPELRSGSTKGLARGPNPDNWHGPQCVPKGPNMAIRGSSNKVLVSNF